MNKSTQHNGTSSRVSCSTNTGDTCFTFAPTFLLDHTQLHVNLSEVNTALSLSLFSLSSNVQHSLSANSRSFFSVKFEFAISITLGYFVCTFAILPVARLLSTFAFTPSLSLLSPSLIHLSWTQYFTLFANSLFIHFLLRCLFMCLS